MIHVARSQTSSSSPTQRRRPSRQKRRVNRAVAGRVAIDRGRPTFGRGAVGRTGLGITAKRAGGDKRGARESGGAGSVDDAHGSEGHWQLSAIVRESGPS